MAGVNLGSAFGRIGIDAGGVRRGIDQAKQAFEEGGRAAQDFGRRLGQGFQQGANVVKAEAANLKQGIRDAMPDSVGTLIGIGIGGAIAGGLASAGSAISAQLDKFAQQGVALGKLNATTGMAVQDLSALSIIARENEISFDSLSTSLARFSRVIADTKGPTANVKEELMLLADQFQSMPDGPEKVELAMQHFGRAGADLIPMLNMGREGLAAYAAELENTGAVMDASMVEAANRLDDAQDRLARSGDRVANVLGSAVVPGLANATDWLARTLEASSKASFGFEALGVLVNAAGEALFGYSAGANTAAAASLNAAGAMNVMSAAAVRAQVQYAEARRASEANSRFMASQSAAAAVLAEREQRDMDRNEVRMQNIRGYNAVLADKSRLATNADREQARLTASTERLTAAEIETGKWADELNERLDGTTKSAGGAAKATQELVEAQDALKERTQGIGSAMGANLGPMSDTEKFQKAWAIATGQTTLAEVEQEAAVKSVMKALEEKRISQQEALATLLALRGGLIDTKQAMAEAGDPSKQFADEVEAVRAMTEGAIEKVRGLSLGINTLPTGKVVGLNINITGQQALLDAHERMAAMRDRDVKLSINVAGMPELNKVYEILVAARGGTPLPGGSPAPGGGGGATPPPGDAGPAAPTPGTGGYESPSEGRVGRGNAGTVIVQVGDDVVANATVNGRGGVGVARKNKARSWRGG